VWLSDESYRHPDFAFGKRGFLLPTIVGEVSYSRHFTRPQLEEKYKAYLTNSNGQLRTAICVDLYYAGTGEKVLKTASDLDRTAISVWVVRDGNVETVMDWVPLSWGGAGIDLYLSDLVDEDDELPPEFIRPRNGFVLLFLCLYSSVLTLYSRPGWPPTIHIPFATMIRELQVLCSLDSKRPYQPRKRKRSSKGKSDEELRAELVEARVVARLREMETKIKAEMEAKITAEMEAKTAARLGEMEAKIKTEIEAKMAAKDRDCRS